jgi:hypothetical protein
LYCGTEVSGASRCYAQPIASGAPSPITPDGTDSALLAPDDATLLYLDANHDAWLTSLGAFTASRRVPQLTMADRPVAFSRDSRAVFVEVEQTIPMQVDRIDVTSGVRTSAAQLSPPDRSGVLSMRLDQWTHDGHVYTYRVQRTLSTLFVVDQK